MPCREKSVMTLIRDLRNRRNKSCYWRHEREDKIKLILEAQKRHETN